MIKWAGAVIGFFIRGLAGAVLGFLAGSFLDSLGGSNSRGPRSVFDDFTRQNVSPADFELNLLSLCSIVIKADGQVSQRELDYVRPVYPLAERYVRLVYYQSEADAKRLADPKGKHEDQVECLAQRWQWNNETIDGEVESFYHSCAGPWIACVHTNLKVIITD